MTTGDPAMIVETGVRWLARAISGKGRFRYRTAPDGSVDPDDYNVLRHSGTIWAMAEARAARGAALGGIDAPLRRAAKYLIDNFTAPAGDHGDLCIVERGIYKLGGNALAVIALTEMVRLTRLPVFLRAAEQLGAGMHHRRLPDGEFVHRQDYGTGQIDSWRSSYYDGQAVFALLRLFDMTGKADWLEAAEQALDRLARREHGIATQDHWTLYALERHAGASGGPRFRAYADAVMRAIIEDTAYRDERRCTPIACRSEGLLAYLRMAGNDIDAAVRGRILAALGENLALQLLCRQPDGSFIEAAQGGDTRIDYIQHNVAAFLGYSLLPGAPPLDAVT